MFSANSNKSNESDTLSKKNFKQISSEIIPIACHIDECTLITKNGELIQTIVIEYNDHSHKLTNTLQETLSSLLSEIGFDVSFWIQTIKVNNVENIDKIPNDQFSNVLLRKIDNYWRNEESRLSNYKVNSYIHFVIKGIDIKIKLSNLLLHLDFRLLNNYHSKYLAKALDQISIVTDRALDLMEEKYNARLLHIKISNHDHNYCYSENLNIFYYLTNFSKPRDDFYLPIANFSKYINCSNYSIEKDYLIISNKQRPQDTKYVSIIGLKNYINLNSSLIVELCSSMNADIVVNEVAIPVAPKTAFEKYTKYLHYLKIHNKGNQIIENMNLQSLLKGDYKDSTKSDYHNFVDQYLHIVLVSSSIDKLKTARNDVTKSLSKYGVVHFLEDIGLERTLYSTIPANFKFIKAKEIINKNQLGRFAMSTNSTINIPKNNFLNNRYIRFISSINNKAIPIGMNEKNPHIAFLYYKKNRDFNNRGFVNLLLTQVINNDHSYVCYFDFDDHSSTLIKALGGESYFIDSDFNLCNPLKISHNSDKELKNNFLKKFLSLLVTHNKKVVTKEMIDKISLIIDGYDWLKLSDLEEIMLKECGVDLAQFVPGGTFGNLFSNNDGIVGKEMYQNFSFDKKLCNENPFIFNAIVWCILISAITKPTDKMKIIVLGNVNKILDSPFFKHQIKFINDLAKANNCMFIYDFSDVDDAICSSNINFTEMMKDCGVQYHMQTNKISSNHREFFRFSDAEISVMQKIFSTSPFSCFLRQININSKSEDDQWHQSPVRINLPLDRKVKNIISDNMMVQKEIEIVLEKLNKDSKYLWLECYLDNDLLEEVESSYGSDEERKISQIEKEHNDQEEMAIWNDA